MRSKALTQELSRDNWLLLVFGIAKELGMPASRVLEEMTDIEILGWSAYFSHLNAEQKKANDEAKRKRR